MPSVNMRRKTYSCTSLIIIKRIEDVCEEGVWRPQAASRLPQYLRSSPLSHLDWDVVA